uniref:PH domain-containing protein n=1 Tax=Cyclopterus lumpus TaxID=8103 RepID=A0A8C2Z9L3_CYCLU
MDDQDRLSQTSSSATISYFPVIQESDGKVQTFGKRCLAAKRDPNCPVVIRGWLNKKDSSGLKLWKRRWFVLSNFCLFYYKDSREESVLGSIPLPSYKILFCTPRECKNRKFTFKVSSCGYSFPSINVVHQGMRSYFFSADTQEDMLGWVRALSQSAAMEPNSSLNRYSTCIFSNIFSQHCGHEVLCSKYQIFFSLYFLHLL